MFRRAFLPIRQSIQQSRRLTQNMSSNEPNKVELLKKYCPEIISSATAFVTFGYTYNTIIEKFECDERDTVTKGGVAAIT
jgi:hypothetical protein